MATVFISFLSELNGAVLNSSKGIKNYLDYSFGEGSFKSGEFMDNAKLQEWLQKQYWKACKQQYVNSRKKISSRVCGLLGLDGLWLVSFESDGAVDDDMIVITKSHKVIGVFANEYDLLRVMDCNEEDLKVKDFEPVASVTRTAKATKPRTMYPYFKGFYFDCYQDFHEVKVYGTEDVDLARKAAYRKTGEWLDLEKKRQKFVATNCYDKEYIELYETGNIKIYDNVNMHF